MLALQVEAAGAPDVGGNPGGGAYGGALGAMSPFSSTEGAMVMGPAQGFGAQLGVTANFTDNVDLKPIDTESDLVWQITPSIAYAHKSPVYSAALGYRLQSLNYMDHSEFNQTYHQAQANGNYLVIPDWFTLGGHAAYSQTIVDPERSINVQNLFPTKNLADVLTAAATPSLDHSFGKAEIHASYSAGFVDYKGTAPAALDLADAHNRDLEASVNSPEEDTGTSWDVKYASDEVRYDLFEPYKYERLTAGLGVPVTAQLRLLGEGGKESDLTKTTTEGGLDSTNWRGGIRLTPNPNDTLEAWYGHRFFGKTYSAHLTHKARFLQVNLQYDEEPITEAQRVALRTFVPGELAPPPTPDVNRPTAQPFLNKYFYGTLELVGRRTSIAFAVYDSRRIYLNQDITESTYGGGVNIARRMGSRSNLSLSLNLAKSRFRDGDGSHDYVGVIEFDRQFSRTVSGVARALYLERSGTVEGDYRAAMATLGIVASF
jgi:hypothetical protein